MALRFVQRPHRIKKWLGLSHPPGRFAGGRRGCCLHVATTAKNVTHARGTSGETRRKRTAHTMQTRIPLVCTQCVAYMGITSCDVCHSACSVGPALPQPSGCCTGTPLTHCKARGNRYGNDAVLSANAMSLSTEFSLTFRRMYDILLLGRSAARDAINIRAAGPRLLRSPERCQPYAHFVGSSTVIVVAPVVLGGRLEKPSRSSRWRSVSPWRCGRFFTAFLKGGKRTCKRTRSKPDNGMG